MTTNRVIQEISRRIGEMQAQINSLTVDVNMLEATLAAKQSTPEPEVKTGVIYDEPEYLASVYFVSPDGIYKKRYNHEKMLHILLQGNLFYDEKSAELEAKRRAIRHRLSKFCRDAWDDDRSILNWEDFEQEKKVLIWDYECNAVVNECHYCLNNSDFCLPVKTYLNPLKEQFTNAELKLALTGSEANE